MTAELYIGLMSGTSLDGVDAAVVDLTSATPKCLGTAHVPYSQAMRQDALALHSPGADDLHTSALFAGQLAVLYASAVSEALATANKTAKDIRAIGAHGQTVRHNPKAGYTLQLLNAAKLAELTHISVVADFRSRDIAAGGEGAPLVPAFHDAVLRHKTEHRIILNLGGIANITDLRPGYHVSGFDTGPGNMLLDAWIQQNTGALFDPNGAWGKQGHASEGLLTKLLSHPFLTMPPPRSCGREEFNLAWLQAQLSGDELAVDVQATLVELTARSIADAIHTHSKGPDSLLICGGGAKNAALVQALAQQLPTTRVLLTDNVGLPADWVEAIAFAWLAQRTLHGLPGNLPAVTGASGPRVLGAIYPA